MATALDVVSGALNNMALFQPGDTIPDEIAEAYLGRLNDYLNGLNSRGAVFENVDLSLSDDVPVADQNVGDLKWALAKYIATQTGKVLGPDAMREAISAENRFINAFTVVYPAVTDAGLRRMPSTRRFWTGS